MHTSYCNFCAGLFVIIQMINPILSYAETLTPSTVSTDRTETVTPLNLNAQKSSRIDEIRPGGISGYELDGTGITVGMWDSGLVRHTHEQLVGRALVEDRVVQLDNHSTHVAGVIAANGNGNPAAKGIAPNVRLRCWNSAGAVIELARDFAGLSVSNHSYNPVSDNLDNPVIFGHYSSSSWALDYLAYSLNHIAVVSAGNNQQLTDDNAMLKGFDSINPIATGKNVITVGSIQDKPDVSTSFDEDWMTEYSSWGPTNDGRIKPDLVANGEQLLSTDSTSDQAYSEMSGTSFAAPVVTGAIACLTQLYRRTFGEYDPSVAVMKAVLLHTAMDDSQLPGPDYKFGWGLLDARAAADFIDKFSKGEDCIIVDAFHGETITIPVEWDGLSPIKATLVWSDPPGSNSGAGNDSGMLLINDLDLSLHNANRIHYPWTLDPSNPLHLAEQSKPNHIDTVEQVFISQPVDGQYMLTIDGSLQRGSSQEFALCLDGIKPIEEKPELWFLDLTGGSTLHYQNQIRNNGAIQFQLFSRSEHGIQSVECFAGNVLLETTQQDEYFFMVSWKIDAVPSGEYEIKVIATDRNSISNSKTIHVNLIQPPVFNFESGLFLPYISLPIDDTDTINELSPLSSTHQYLVKIQEKGTYRFYTESAGIGADADTYIQLYSTFLLFDRVEISFNDDGGDGYFSSITIELNPGDYVLECQSVKESYGFYKVGVEKTELEELTGMIPVEVNGLSVSSPYIIEAGKEQWFRFETGSFETPTNQVRGQLYTIEVSTDDSVLAQVEMELYRVVNQQRFFVERWPRLITSYRFSEQATYDLKVKLNEFIGTYDVNINRTNIFPNQTINADEEPVRFSFQGDEKTERWFVFRPNELGSYSFIYSNIEGHQTLPTLNYYIEDKQGDLKHKYIPNQPRDNTVRFNHILEQSDQVSFYLFSDRRTGTYELSVQKRVRESMPILIRRKIESETYQAYQPVKVQLIVDVVVDSELGNLNGNPGLQRGHFVNIIETPPANVNYFYKGKELINDRFYEFIETDKDFVIEYFIIPNEFVDSPLRFYGEGSISPYFADESLNKSFVTLIEGDTFLDAVASSVKDWDLY